MSVLVRGAGRRDLEAIHALWFRFREAQVKSDEILRLSAEAETAARTHREVILADPRSRFLVAEQQGEVLGFSHAQIEAHDPIFEPDRYGVIVDLIVREDRRGHGIGRQLLEHTLEWFASRGVHEARVTVAWHDRGAKEFFERVGGRALSRTFRFALAREA